MTSEATTTIDELSEIAAQWFARMDSGEGNHAEFEAWRAADPRHAAAFARVYASMRQMEKLRGLTAPVEPLPKPTRRSFLTTGRLAAGVIAAVAVGAIGYNFGGGRVRAETAVGERKSVRFSDGSQLELNTNTKAAWHVEGNHRELWLERGEVAVRVATNSAPLHLQAGKHTAELAPGEYIARLRDTSLDLISLSGTATVGSGQSNPMTVAPNQAAILTQGAGRVRSVSSNDLHFLTGWRSDELVLSGQVLSEVIEEYNRYLDKKIIIADPDIGAIPIGGRFANHDPSKLLAGLESSFDIHVAHESNSIILSR
ncbi:FecR domain-containing protein [Asticcacaulis sp. YBE204]|uniref:FecR family protein n=1 Tax=Asticcacaulis sp. YBE204 TaxID=1282363 RepID=UPI0003C4078A|nr:FecR domain-containing protein [Asticcacaulis sp. YBE204]ESQ78674.1 hypothetical protein AEYBE204_11865 [Asticcacaulis sp. YBE204]